MFRNLRSLLLATAALAGGFAAPTAYSQPAAPQTGAATGPNDKLFNDPAPAEGGWQGLANLLEALTPSADTSIPLTPSQITDRISTMLDQGRNQDALDIIEKRISQRKAENAMGNDVQLMFLHARALSAVGRHQEAIEVYLNMTTQFPELPEPWNNLAAEYVKNGQLDMARDALQMALTADPNYADAKANMGRVQLMLAKESFDQAKQLGVPGAAAQSDQTKAILQK